MATNIKTTRFSGLEWADQIRPILLIGAGGIGSWTALNLSRIGHDLIIMDMDIVDETNVTGGQMFRKSDINSSKVSAVANLCKDFGTTNKITALNEKFVGKEHGTFSITITALDNMEARKDAFVTWEEEYGANEDSLFIDGRLLAENAEVLAIQGGNKEQIGSYLRDYMFDDSSVPEVDCTIKQTTFAAMGISSLITATVCNFLTNKKLDIKMRNVPFYQRLFYPLFSYSVKKPEIDPLKLEVYV